MTPWPIHHVRECHSVQSSQAAMWSHNTDSNWLVSNDFTVSRFMTSVDSYNLCWNAVSSNKCPQSTGRILWIQVMEISWVQIGQQIVDFCDVQQAAVTQMVLKQTKDIKIGRTGDTRFTRRTCSVSNQPLFDGGPILEELNICVDAHVSFCRDMKLMFSLDPATPMGLCFSQWMSSNLWLIETAKNNPFRERKCVDCIHYWEGWWACKFWESQSVQDRLIN